MESQIGNLLLKSEILLSEEDGCRVLAGVKRLGHIVLNRAEAALSQPIVEKKLLDEDQKVRLLAVLAARFKARWPFYKKKLGFHKMSLKWPKIEQSLRNNSKALWSIQQLELLGHEPNIYYADENYFHIGSCTREPPLSTMGTSYFQAEATTKVIDVEFMPPKEYLRLKDFMKIRGYFWLRTNDEILIYGDNDESGHDYDEPWLSPYVSQPDSDYLSPDEYEVEFCHDYNTSRDGFGWRGCIKVPWSLEK